MRSRNQHHAQSSGELGINKVAENLMEKAVTGRGGSTIPRTKYNDSNVLREKQTGMEGRKKGNDR